MTTTTEPQLVLTARDIARLPDSPARDILTARLARVAARTARQAAANPDTNPDHPAAKAARRRATTEAWAAKVRAEAATMLAAERATRAAAADLADLTGHRRRKDVDAAAVARNRALEARRLALAPVPA